MALMRTVGELVAELLTHDQDAYVGVHSGEDGGMYVNRVTVQRRDDESTHLYYQGDSPVRDPHTVTSVLVTIDGSGYWECTPEREATLIVKRIANDERNAIRDAHRTTVRTLIMSRLSEDDRAMYEAYAALSSGGQAFGSDAYRVDSVWRNRFDILRREAYRELQIPMEHF